MLKLYKFSELSGEQVLEIFKARMEVFIVEQNCVYQDIDAYDKSAYHLCDWSEEGELRAYARVLDKGAYASFGLVIVPKEFRGQGLAKDLIATVIDVAGKIYRNKDLIISGQSYLLDFYKSFGFVEISEEYLEDDIPHVDLKLTK